MKKQRTRALNDTRRNRKMNRRYNESLNEESSPKKAIITLVVVLVVFFSVYFIAMLITGEIKLGTEPKEEVPEEIQYQEIIVGKMFNRPESSYLVLLGSFTDYDTTLLMQDADRYMSTNDDADYVYYVDLDKGFNKGHHSEEESNPKAQTLEELMVKNPTLVRIQDGKIVDYIEGKDEIEAYFFAEEE